MLPLGKGELELRDDRVVLRILMNAASQINNLDVYRHDNGFVKILLGIHSGKQVRVHIWDRDFSQEMSSSIHSHRHPILSRVVLGAFKEERWLNALSGKAFRRYDFSPSLPGRMELTESGVIRLRPAPTHTRQAGDVYAIPLNVFHAVRPLTIPTITVFTQDLRLRSDGIVASESQLEKLARPSLMQTRDRAALHGIISKLISETASKLGDTR
ncbi:hypothetical protein ACT89R_17740 [Rhodococcus qingshengii]